MEFMVHTTVSTPVESPFVRHPCIDELSAMTPIWLRVMPQH